MKLWTITPCLLALSCAPGPAAPQGCAKVASLTAISPEEGLQHPETSGVGGYLIAHHAKDAMSWNDPSTYTKSHCTALIVRSLRNPNELAFWTAAHCIDYATISKLEFARYDTRETVDGFGTWPVGNSLQSMVETITLLRSMTGSIPPSVFHAFFEVFSNRSERNGAKWCKQFTDLQKDANAYQICTSLEDMEFLRFDIPPPEKRDPSFQEMYSALMATPEITDPDMKQRLKEWELAYIEVSNYRMWITMARYMDRIRACPATGGDDFCQNKVQAESLARSFFPQLVRWYPEKTEAEALEAFESAKANLYSMWHDNILANVSTGILDRLSIHGGFRFVDVLPDVAPEFSAENVPTRTAFLALPYLLGLNAEAQSQVSVAFGTQGLLLSRPRSHAFRFWHGDSGTLVSFQPQPGVSLPIGVISTVDGEPTSGGLAMRPTNSGEEEDSGGSGTPEASGPPLKGTPIASQCR